MSDRDLFEDGTATEASTGRRRFQPLTSRDELRKSTRDNGRLGFSDRVGCPETLKSGDGGESGVSGESGV